ncbi:hypothetical protein [Chitinophaga sp.]|uniref:glycosyltransferase family 2 protein n=1 Tax=Chitinophaga sp. TaxID=1869181 RepID=UPI002CE31413|nr:hypothetical protein [Chitinophaga sp.]HWV64365.1 hypothetical protein [Chitinophaga sp.]
MKVAVLMLSYERYDTLKRVLDHNLANAGHPFDLFIWDNGSKDERVLKLFNKSEVKTIYSSHTNEGIARPFNFMLSGLDNLQYDAYHFMANDILEPDNWLYSKIKYLEAIPNSGMIAHCPGDTGYPYNEIAGRPLYIGDVIGNCMISRQVFQKVGAFREDFGLYGPIDCDYNTRCRIAGFINYYIPGKSIHLDDGDRNLYGYNKDEAVAKTWPVYVDSIDGYLADPDSIYKVPDGETNFNAEQYVQ